MYSKIFSRDRLSCLNGFNSCDNLAGCKFPQNPSLIKYQWRRFVPKSGVDINTEDDIDFGIEDVEDDGEDEYIETDAGKLIHEGDVEVT